MSKKVPKPYKRNLTDFIVNFDNNPEAAVAVF